MMVEYIFYCFIFDFYYIVYDGERIIYVLWEAYNFMHVSSSSHSHTSALAPHSFKLGFFHL
jgi:hypothetical protein